MDIYYDSSFLFYVTFLKMYLVLKNQLLYDFIHIKRPMTT